MDTRTRHEMLSLLPRLRRLAIALTGSSEAGDDLVQATYEQAIRHIDKWQPGSRLDRWMFQIARNINLNNLRHLKVRGPAVDPMELDNHHSHDGQRAVEAKVTLERVRAYIDALPEEQRSILLLICVEGFTYAEVSQMLDMPISTIATRLGRLQIALKEFADTTEESDDLSRRVGER